jgi:rod shape-determining protein MreC
MSKLLAFLFKKRYLLTFLLLEFFCLWLILSYNTYPRSAWLHSANRVSAGLFAFASEIEEYFLLKEYNQQLALENTRLQLQLEKLQLTRTEIRYGLDTTIVAAQEHTLKLAKVINNSTLKTNNYFTIDKGSLDGIEKGMGIVLPQGVLGMVQHVSDHYSSCISILNPRLMVSVKVLPSGSLGMLRWSGKDTKTAELYYVPRHFSLQKGDSIVTTGYNLAFPAGLWIGTVEEQSLKPEDAFHTVSVRLHADVNALHYVYVFKHGNRAELDSLQKNLFNSTE